MRTEVLDWGEFFKGNVVVISQRPPMSAKYKWAIRIGMVSLTIASTHPIHPQIVHAATQAAQAHASSVMNGSFNHLVDALLRILDPVAKVFGMIAGIAIMTGNGKIGLERLFWLSIGYITARKVDVWIEFLNTI